MTPEQKIEAEAAKYITPEARGGFMIGAQWAIQQPELIQPEMEKMLTWIADKYYSEPGNRDHWHAKVNYHISLTHQQLVQEYLNHLKQQK
jgi:hypothetical protein